MIAWKNTDNLKAAVIYLCNLLNVSFYRPPADLLGDSSFNLAPPTEQPKGNGAFSNVVLTVVRRRHPPGGGGGGTNTVNSFRGCQVGRKQRVCQSQWYTILLVSVTYLLDTPSSPTSSRIWNNLPDVAISSDSIDQFKSQLAGLSIRA